MFTISTDLGEKTMNEITGLHEDSQVTLKEVNDTLQQIFTLITGLSVSGGEELSKEMGGKIKKVVGNEDSKITTDEKGGKQDGGPAKLNTNIQVNDLNGIGANYVMGSLLVNTTLLNFQKEISGLLSTIITNMSSGGGKKDKGAKESKSPKMSANPFGIDPKEFKGLADALTEFAKGAIILSLVPTKIVEKATKSFQIFINGMVECANNLHNHMKDFNTFAQGVKNIVESLKQFSLAVFLMALVLPFTPMALLSTKAMVKMIEMVGEAGKLAKETHPFIKEITKAFLQMSFAFAIMGFTLLLLIEVGKNFMDAMKGMLALTVFMGVTILAGWLCTLALGPISGMISTFVLLGVAMIIFSVAVNLMSKIKVDQDAVNNVLNAIRTIATSFSMMMPFMIGALLSVVMFTVFSVLFATSMLLFVAGLGLLVVSQNLLGKLELTDKGGFKVIDQINEIASSFAKGLGIYLLGTLGALAFTLFSALFMVGMIVFTVGVALLWVTDMLLQKLVDEDGNNRAIKNMVQIAVQIGADAGVWIAGSLAMVPALIFAVELAVFSIASTIAVLGMYETKKVLDKMGDIKDINASGKKLQEAGIGMMLGFLGIEHNHGDSVGLGTLAKAGINAVKLTSLGVLALATVIPIAAFMIAAKSIGQAFVSLTESMQGVNPATIEVVFGGLTMVISSLATVANELKGSSAKTITAIGGLVKDVAEAINMITDVVIKLKDGIPEEQIDAATASMLYMCERLFGRPGEKPKNGQYTLCSTLESIASADLKKLNAEAVTSITPLIDGIDRMADLVIKLADTEKFSQDKIDTGIKNMERFLNAVTMTAEGMLALVKEVPSGEKSGWWIFKSDVMTSPLAAVQEVVESGFFESFDQVISGLSSAGDALGNFQVSNLEQVTNFLSSGTIPMAATQAPALKKSLENFAEGINALKEAQIKSLNNFINALSRAGENTFTKAVDNLIKLGNVSKQFKSIADSMERMADSMKKMADKEKKVVNIFDAIKNSSAEKAERKMPTNAEAAIGGTTINPYVEKIYDVLAEWSISGVPIRGNFNQATGELIPDEAGNSVGLGVSRK